MLLGSARGGSPSPASARAVRRAQSRDPRVAGGRARAGPRRDRRLAPACDRAPPIASWRRSSPGAMRCRAVRAGATCSGYKLTELADAAGQRTARLRALARPALELVQAATGESANLSVLAAPSAVYVDQVEGTRAVRMLARIGAAVPAHASAAGKAMLAREPAGSAGELLGGDPLPAFTANTITTLEALEAELEADPRARIRDRRRGARARGRLRRRRDRRPPRRRAGRAQRQRSDAADRRGRPRGPGEASGQARRRGLARARLLTLRRGVAVSVYACDASPLRRRWDRRAR